MGRSTIELNRIINQCVLNTLMTIKLCGCDTRVDEASMIRCVAIRLDQVIDEECNHPEPLEDFDIDYYINAYLERVLEDVNNDQKDV